MVVLLILLVSVAALVSVAGVLAAIARWRTRASASAGTRQAQQITFQALHTASMAVSALRDGLTPAAAATAAPALQQLFGVPVIALADRTGLLHCAGPDQHDHALRRGLREVVSSGRERMLGAADLCCAHGDGCPAQAGAAVPIVVGGATIGALAALGSAAELGGPAGAALLRTASEVARLVASQLAMAEVEASRLRATQAKLHFLRAQISPHFIYNALTAIESYVRSDPERARDLLAGFAEFTRWAFREHTQYATLAEELRFVDIYLELERARFGDRLAISLRIAPEVLPVMVPSLVLQPLVENAVRHGLDKLNGPARLEICAEDRGREAVVTVADHGVGADPRMVEELLAGQRAGESVGLRNVDERLRAIYGNDHGLSIRTGVGAGMTVTMRLPKLPAAAAAAAVGLAGEL
ncbi:MAG TPA: histidine kinase [Trebonia sp.]|nr:histidine kinase [Trebonia sp.]